MKMINTALSSVFVIMALYTHGSGNCSSRLLPESHRYCEEVVARCKAVALAAYDIADQFFLLDAQRAHAPHCFLVKVVPRVFRYGVLRGWGVLQHLAGVLQGPRMVPRLAHCKSLGGVRR